MFCYFGSRPLNMTMISLGYLSKFQAGGFARNELDMFTLMVLSGGVSRKNIASLCLCNMITVIISFFLYGISIHKQIAK